MSDVEPIFLALCLPLVGLGVFQLWVAYALPDLLAMRGARDEKGSDVVQRGRRGRRSAVFDRIADANPQAFDALAADPRLTSAMRAASAAFGIGTFVFVGYFAGFL